MLSAYLQYIFLDSKNLLYEPNLKVKAFKKSFPVWQKKKKNHSTVFSREKLIMAPEWLLTAEHTEETDRISRPTHYLLLS